jgi:glutathione S-transferase
MITGKIGELFLEPNFATHFSFLESQLETSPNGGEYLCGKELTEADLMMIFPLEGAKAWAGMDEKKYPSLCRYLEKLKERESYKRAVERVVDVEGSFKAIF